MTTAVKSVKTVVKSAVIPVVTANGAKQVFLKIAKSNAVVSLEATVRNLANAKNDAFDGDIKLFVKEHGIKNLQVWKSKVAFVRPALLARSATIQIKMWKKLGYNVVNHAQFVNEAAVVQAEAVAV